MTKLIATRNAYGEALKKYGAENKDVIAIDADLSCCTMSNVFGETFPDRFFNVGIAEGNMIGMAAGMATCGKIVFAHTFAMFATGRSYDQVRNSVCYPGLNVKIVGTHAGLSVGEDGATHQCIEDIALMRVIPGMTVINPCDHIDTDAAVRAMIEYDGPCYLRLGRAAVETAPRDGEYAFELGKGVQMVGGNEATIVATGLMVQQAIKASKLLAKENISARVINIHTIKPIDEDIIIKAAKETGAIVTTEEHNVIGGLGGAVSEVVSQVCPVPVIKHGVMDVFGRSGRAEDLMVRFELTPEKIVQNVKKAISLKSSKN